MAHQVYGEVPFRKLVRHDDYVVDDSHPLQVTNLGAGQPAGGQSLADMFAGALTTFNALNTESRYNHVSVEFSSEVPSEAIVTDVSTGTSSITQDGSKAVIAAGGSSTAGTIAVRSRQTSEYHEGHETLGSFTAGFVLPADATDPAAGVYARIGLANSTRQEAFWLGWEPTLPGGPGWTVCRRYGGVDDTTTDLRRAQGDWEDALDGVDPLSLFTRKGSPETWIPVKSNHWRIAFGWHGNAPTGYGIGRPDGGYVPFALHRWPNLLEDASIGDPNVGMFIEVGRATPGDEVAVRTSSWAIGPMLGSPVIQIDDGNSYDYRTDGPLAANTSWVGQWFRLREGQQLSSYFQSDQDSTVSGMHIHTTPSPALAALGYFKDENYDYIADTVRTFQTPPNARYARLEFDNGPVDANLVVQALVVPQATVTSIHRLDAELPGDRTSTLVKAVQMGAKPGGNTFKNVPRDGRDDGNSWVNQAVSAGSPLTGTAISTDGYRSVGISVYSDQVSATEGLVASFYDDEALTKFVGQVAVTITADLLNEGHKFPFAPLAEWMVVSYAHGGTPGTSTIVTTLHTDPVQDTASPLSGQINPGLHALHTRSQGIGQDPESGWLSSTVRAVTIDAVDRVGSDINLASTSAEVQPATCTTHAHHTVTPGAVTPSRLDAAGVPADRKYITIGNADSKTIYYRINVAAGWTVGVPIPPDSVVQEEVGPNDAVYVIASTGTAVVHGISHGGSSG